MRSLTVSKSKSHSQICCWSGGKKKHQRDAQDVTAVRGHYLVTLTQTECWPQRNASQLCWSDQQVFTFLPPVVMDDLSIPRIWWCALAVPTTTAESVTATMRGANGKDNPMRKTEERTKEGEKNKFSLDLT